MKRIKLQPKVKTTIKLTPILMYSALIGGVSLIAFIIFLTIGNVGTYISMKANYSVNLTGFTWNKTIDINTGSYQQNDLYNFVCQINVTDPDFMLASNGGKIIQSDASDIVFVDQNENRVKFKVKKYNSNNGNIVLWLKLDTLKANKINTINMYFGNSNPPVYNDTVFDSEYVAYWPFDDTFTNVSLTNYNQTPHGQLSFKSSLNEKALKAQGDPDYIHLNDNSNLTLGSEGTVGAWININDFKDYGGIIHKGDKKDFSDEEYSLQLWNDKRLLFAIFDNNNSKKLYSSKLDKETWYYVVATWNPSGMKLYLNGLLDSETNQTLITSNKNSGLNIGAQLNQNFNSSLKRIHFDGLIDEPFIMKSSANQDFASVSYAMITKSSEIITLSETKSKVINLPVELADFRGISDNDNIIISWFTLSELNNTGFYVHHSIDGLSYNEIGFVNGHGTVNDVNYYSLTYPVSESGTHYFKLMQVDIDGKFKFYGPISVNSDGNNTIEIKSIYPDPFIDHLKIDLTSNDETNIKVKIIDMNGKELSNDLYFIQSGYNTLNLKNVSFLKVGLYSLNIFDDRSMIFAGKIIKR